VEGIVSGDCGRVKSGGCELEASLNND